MSKTFSVRSFSSAVGMRGLAIALVPLLAVATACGPTARNDGMCTATSDTTSDPNNCGMCGMVCPGGTCVNSVCVAPACDTEGATQACYDGPSATEGVGPCVGGTQTCTNSAWGPCVGEVVPVGEICGDHIDNNCNGTVDEDVDNDGDGFTTCQGDCCDGTAECADPTHVNPGAYDVPGDGVDNDCNGHIDDPQNMCAAGVAANTADPTDYAKAIDICQQSTPDAKTWGLLSSKLSLTDGTGTVASDSRSIRDHYGTGISVPHSGANFAIISSGMAADANESNPGPAFDFADFTGTSAAFPADFLAAHQGSLPNAPGCPAPIGNSANDPVMLTFSIRVPTNAQSFSIDTNFFSAEYPEYTCTEFNDFFVVLLDSTATGNPADKNLATYTAANGDKYPVGVNLAFGNTGLFRDCVNGTTGCDGTVPGTQSSCTSAGDLAGTGLDQSSPGSCDNNSLVGGGTGWLRTTGNVTPGETITLRIAIWDTSDEDFDSLALIDNFQWSPTPATSGTIIIP